MTKDRRHPPKSPVKPITRQRITTNTGERVTGIMNIKPEVSKVIKKRMRDGHILHQQYVVER
jgi:hypothetical protein